MAGVPTGVLGRRRANHHPCRYGKLPKVNYVTPPSPLPDASPAGINVKALWALPTAVVISLVGVVLAHVARAEIRRTGERGDGLARSALLIGYPIMALWTLLWIALSLTVLLPA